MNFLFSPAFAADEPVASAPASADATPSITSASTAAPVPYEISAEKMMWDNLLILGVLFFIFYFVLIRPQQIRLKQHTAMMKSLTKGSKVITSGGIIGTIVKFEGEDVAVIEIAQGVKIRMAKSSISEIADEKVASGSIANDN